MEELNTSLRFYPGTRTDGTKNKAKLLNHYNNSYSDPTLQLYHNFPSECCHNMFHNEEL